MILPSPAKLNLFLHITGRRPDGYHNLQTIFQFLDYGDTLGFTVRTDGQIALLATNTAAGTTGAQTINKPSGTVNFAAAATSLVVTNALCTMSSIVFATIRTNDSTAVIKNVVPGSGSFTITLNAAATAETSVGFLIIN